MIGNEVIGYGRKQLTNKFKLQYPSIEFQERSIPRIPDEYEYQMNFKEFYADFMSDQIVNEYLLSIVEEKVSGMVYELQLSENWLLECMEYLKMDEHERDNMFHLYYHIRTMKEDLSPQDDSLVGFSYNDYVVISSIIEDYLKG